MDWFDAFVHVALTGALMGIVGVTDGPEAFYPGLTGISLLVFAVRRHIGIRHGERTGLTTGEMTAARLAEMEMRLAELEAAHARVAELEERVEFAERLLLRPAKGVEQS